MDDLAGRLTKRTKLTTDGHRAYLEAVEGAFSADYAMLAKLYSPAPGGTTGSYNPAECTGINKSPRPPIT